MTPEKIIELAQSVGLTLPRRGDYFFINHEDLAKLLVARSEACAKVCEDERNDPDDQFKKYENTHDDGWIDGCNSCILAIKSMDDQ